MKIASISQSNVTLAHLRVLEAVVAEGGFTAAAGRLGLTQSGVSQAIQSLEDTLGVALLTRGRERTEPTEIGRRVLAEAGVTLRSIARIHEHCASWSGLDGGSLRIGSVVSAAARVLPDLLRDFRIRYPNVSVTMLEGSDTEVRDWTVGDAVDIGFTAEIATEFDGELIAEDEFIVVVSRRHHAALKPTLSIRDVSAHPFIMSAAGCEPAIRAIFAQKQLEPKIAFSVRDMTTLLEMVRQGLGVTIIPELSLLREKAGLRVIKLTPPCRRRLLMVRKHREYPVPTVGAFFDLVRSRRTNAKGGASLLPTGRLSKALTNCED
jgi:DNA-binding transcriptional LysR family regulator